MTAETVRNLNATVLIYMMKLFTLVCCFVVDLPHGRRLYWSNPGVNNSLVSNSNGWDALNVITSMTSQMYVPPLSKCSIQQAALSDRRGFFADFVHKRTRTHTHNLIPHAHIQTQIHGYKRTWESFLPPNTICCFFVRAFVFDQSQRESFFLGSAALWDTICRLISSSGGKKKNSSRSHSKTGAHTHIHKRTHRDLVCKRRRLYWAVLCSADQSSRGGFWQGCRGQRLAGRLWRSLLKTHIHTVYKTLIC